MEQPGIIAAAYQMLIDVRTVKLEQKIIVLMDSTQPPSVLHQVMEWVMDILDTDQLVIFDLFSKADADMDGALDQDELEHILTAMVPQRPLRRGYQEKLGSEVTFLQLLDWYRVVNLCVCQVVLVHVS